MLEIKGNVYVVVCERDTADRNQINHGPIVLETLVLRATREKALERMKKFSRKFGECRIARLVFENDDAEGDADASNGDAGNAS